MQPLALAPASKQQATKKRLFIAAFVINTLISNYFILRCLFFAILAQF